MIIVAGSVNTDLVAQVSHHPAAGETLLAEGYAVHQGGKGANQAVAAARLGAEVGFIGAIGEDDFGRAIKANLQQEGIDTQSLQIFAGNSGLALITVDTNGENRIVVVPGANGKLDDKLDLTSAMANAQAVLLQLETPLSFVNAAIRAGQNAGAEIILNAAPAQSLAKLNMAAVDWLLVNEGEAAFLLDEAAGQDRQTVNEQAARLARQYQLGVIATLGADGALWVQADGQAGHVPGQQCEVVDTTGAGDTFAGAFAAARLEGQAIRQAIELASAAAALSVGRAGARNGMPNRQAVKQALGQ